MKTSKSLIKKYTKIICFIGILIAVLKFTYNKLSPYVEGHCVNFYKQEENTVDVLFIGSSNVYANINPAKLWNDKGIASFIFAGSGQPVWNSYYYLKEAYKTQKPKVVVVDMLNLNMPYDYDDISLVYQHTKGLKWSSNKIDAIKNSAQKENWGNLVFEWPIFHNRWKEVTGLGVKDERFGALKKGFYPVHYSVLDYNYDYRPEYNYSSDIHMTEKNEKYTRMIIELAQSNGSEVLLFKTPYIIDENADSIYNQAEDIAREYSVKTLNMNKLDFGFIYALELGDTQHLNDYGVDKVTAYLEEYLKNHYTIPDRRNQKGYESWETYNKEYENSHWLSPQVKSANVVFKKAAFTIDHVQYRDGVSVISCPFMIEPDTYYRVTLGTHSEKNGKIILDLYSPDGYDNAEQETWAPVYEGEKWSGYVVLYSGMNVPENAEMRFLVGGEDIRIDISDVTVEKLQLK